MRHLSLFSCRAGIFIPAWAGRTARDSPILSRSGFIHWRQDIARFTDWSWILGAHLHFPPDPSAQTSHRSDLVLRAQFSGSHIRIQFARVTPQRRSVLPSKNFSFPALLRAAAICKVLALAMSGVQANWFPDCVWIAVGESRYYSWATRSKSSSFLSSNCSHTVVFLTRS
jgi:hypothetical protein